MRFQNIDAYEDIFAVKKVIVGLCKKVPLIITRQLKAKTLTFFQNSSDDTKKSLHLIATKSGVFGVYV